MAMEYAQVSVQQAIGESGAFDVKTALRFTRHAASGLAHAMTRGVIHRDVKPSNMLLAETGELKLADFGLASRTGTKGNGLVGTPHYMAPEVWQGEGADAVSDVYSLGCCLYFMLFAKPPFVAETYSALKQAHLQRNPLLTGSLPPAVSELLRWMMAKEPASRPQDFQHVVERIFRMQSSAPGRELASEPVSERPAPFSERPAPRPASTLSERVAAGVVEHPRFASAADSLSRALLDNSPILGLAGAGWRMQPFLLNKFLEQHSERAFVLARIAVSQGSLIDEFNDVLLQTPSVRPGVYDEIASRLASGRRPRVLCVVQLAILRSLYAEEVSDIVELARRLRGQRVVLQVGCYNSVRQQLDQGFALAGLTSLPRWLEIKSFTLQESWKLVEEWSASLPNGLTCSPSSKLLLAASVRDEPENAPRMMHNAIACAQWSDSPIVTTFACRAGAAHKGFLESSSELEPKWLTPPGQWPDAETHREVQELRAELSRIPAVNEPYA